MGSLRACRNASSNRLESASPRVFSESTDCWKIASRRAASSARIRCASLSSGLLPRSGSLCDTTRPRFVSMTSVDWQHGQVTSSSLLRRAIVNLRRQRNTMETEETATEVTEETATKVTEETGSQEQRRNGATASDVTFEGRREATRAKESISENEHG